MSSPLMYGKTWTCGTCQYWERVEKGVGECRLKPPVLNHEAEPYPLWEFPSVKEGSWCGEGSPREGAAKKGKK